MKDKVTFVFLIILSIFWIVKYYTFDSQSSLRKDSPVGTIVYFSNFLTSRSSNSLFWSQVNNIRDVYAGDELLSGDHSHALILLKSGTKLQMGSNSLIKLSPEKDGYDLNVRSGRLTVSEVNDHLVFSNETKLQDGKLELVSASKEGSVRIDATGPNLQLSSKGRVELKLNNTTVVLNNEQVGIANSGKVVSEKAPAKEDITSELVELLGDLSPANQEVVRLRKGNLVRLSWTGPGKKYEVETINMSGKKEHRVLEGKSSMLYDPKGSQLVRWQVSSVGTDKVFNSGPLSFYVNYNLNLAFLLPTKKDVFTVGMSEIPFKWSAGPEERFVFKISQDKDLLNEVEVFNVEGDSFNYRPKKAGQYYYSLKAKAYENVVVSDGPVKVEEKAATLKFPEDASVVAFDKDEAPVQFSWEKAKTTERLELLVAKDDSFKEPLIKRTVQKNEETVLFNQQGTYFWKVVPSNEKSGLTSSAVFKFELSNTIFNVKLPPLHPVTLNKFSNKEYQEFSIPLPKMDQASFYEILVSTDKDFAHIVFNAKWTSNNVSWVTNLAGRFYFKYRIYDQSNKASRFSNSSSLIINNN